MDDEEFQRHLEELSDEKLDSLFRFYRHAWERVADPEVEDKVFQTFVLVEREFWRREDGPRTEKRIKEMEAQKWTVLGSTFDQTLIEKNLKRII